VRSGNATNFKNFLETISPINIWYFPQIYFINHNSKEGRTINYIGKYENYTTDINYILNTLKIPIQELPNENRNPIFNRHPQLNDMDYYKILYKDSWCKDWVLERYKNDFKFFNYELDI
jgi:hypothetical protein